jgi:hypothetical protein
MLSRMLLDRHDNGVKLLVVDRQTQVAKLGETVIALVTSRVTLFRPNHAPRSTAAIPSSVRLIASSMLRIDRAFKPCA